MAEEQELAQHDIERESVWRSFLSRISGWANPQRDVRAWLRSVRESPDTYTSHADYFIAMLSPDRLCRLSLGRDLQAMQHLLSSVRKAAEDGIITDDEASALMEFVASRFVERRFDCILSDVFGGESTHRYTFHRVTGKTTHGRERELAR